MISANRLRAEGNETGRLQPVHRVMTFTGDDLGLGAGTVLARFDRAAAQTGLALDEPAEERLLALLAAAYGAAVDRKILGNIRRASNYRRDGQQALAAIELALTGLSPLVDEQEASNRLYLADRLIDSGVAPREVTKALAIDPAPSNRLKAGFNPSQPRVPAGNSDGGQWSDGSGAAVTPVVDQKLPGPSGCRAGDADKFSKFFDTLYPKINASAQQLGIDETWILGLSAYESEWLNPHNRAPNNPFGVTHGGGPNVAYGSIADAVAYWEKKYGPVVRGAASPTDFAQRLWDAGYNRANSDWRNGVVRTIRSIPPHLRSWESKRGGL